MQTLSKLSMWVDIDPIIYGTFNIYERTILPKIVFGTFVTYGSRTGMLEKIKKPHRLSKICGSRIETEKN
jgi:hypothetical protein